MTVGALLIVANDPLARLLARALPWRGEVKSAGTFFPEFSEAAPVILSRTGWMLIALPLLAVVSARARSHLRLDRRLEVAVAATTIGATAVWFWWLATPHNAFPTNARIHWVDYLTFRTERLFYAAGRIPHAVFYDSPPIWQALNAAILVGLCILIASKLGFSLVTSSLLSLVVATSGNLLRFANSAEDVFINVTLVLIAVYASLTRRSVWFGIALAALLLGRPQFAVLFPAVAAAEFSVAARQRRLPNRREIRFVGLTLAVAIAGVAATQVFFEVIGERYFFHNGQIVDVGTLESATPQEIDTFTISAFSGTYVLHFVWVLPVVITMLAIAAVIRAPRLGPGVEAPLYFWGFAVVTLVALHEAQPLLYFNIRYLTYAFPFLVVMSWALLRSVVEQGDAGAPPPDDVTIAGQPRRAVIGAACFWLVLLAPTTIPGDPITVKRILERRPEIELLDIRAELRTLAEGRIVYLDFPSNSTRNYVTYVLRAPVADVRLLSETPYQDGGLVISLAADPWSDQEPVLATDRLVVIDPER